MSKTYKTARVITRVTKPGKFKTADHPAVAPETEEVAVGSPVKTSDFSKEDFAGYLASGAIVEVLTNTEVDAAAAFYAGKNPADEHQETDDQKRQRLANEAKLLGVTGIQKNMKLETLEEKVAIARAEKDKREDGTNPSTQEGAGLPAGTAGGDGNGAGGNAEGTAEGAAGPDLVG